jgi:hypothetical protein
MIVCVQELTVTVIRSVDWTGSGSRGQCGEPLIVTSPLPLNVVAPGEMLKPQTRLTASIISIPLSICDYVIGFLYMWV